MSRSGRLGRAIVGISMVATVALPGRAVAQESFQAVVLPQAQLFANGAGILVHTKVRCTPPASGVPDTGLARVDQVTGPKTVQREASGLYATCDGAWHKVSAAVPVPEKGIDEETGNDNVAPRAWQPTTALVRIENGFSDPEILAAGVVQVQPGSATPSSDPAIAIPATARRVAAGAGTRVRMTMDCPAGDQAFLNADFAQVLSKKSAERSADGTIVACTGAPQSVDLVFAAIEGQAWHQGPAFIDAVTCDQVCHPAWRTVQVIQPTR